MKRFISFGSIGQFNSVIKDVNWKVQDENIQLPKITAIGSEKIHGTNASVCYSDQDGFWVQSRKNIINLNSDNMGCALAAYTNQQVWIDIINFLALEYNIDLNANVISIYYEWSGGNVQRISALSGLDKRAVIFQYFKVSPLVAELDESGQEISVKWFKTCGSDGYIESPEDNIWNIMKFPTVEIEIDFNQPFLSQNKMIEMVERIENESLVGKSFGINGNTGEGYVFTFEFDGDLLRFKVKGDKHAKGAGKIKRLHPVNEEEENKIITFVNDVACVSWRLEQMYNEILQENNGITSIKMMSSFLKKVMKDTHKEESYLIIEQELNVSKINKKIAQVAKIYFQSKLDEM